jgi:ferredoxin-NADP reductase/Na+-translocating ferredoxin:NAD+ oxidoreductase RnfD subunit
MNIIDRLLNGVTMYRLVLWCLTALSLISIVFAYFGWVPFLWWQGLLSLVVLIAVGFLVNLLFGYVFRVPLNIESVFVTSFILFLVMSPAMNGREYVLLAITAAVAMASKYILAWRGKHFFNPAALGAFTVGTYSGLATWWVGTPAMLALVLIAGLLVVRKIRRFQMVSLFLFVVFALRAGMAMRAGERMGDAFLPLVVSYPLVFFASIMFTEPLTTPPTRRLQFIYAAIVGVLFVTPFHVGPIVQSPELALLIGNVFAFLFGSRDRIWLTLRETREIARGTREFVFDVPRPIQFAAGQYIEWTLPHPKPDARGNRRFFTIAASPTESVVRLGVRGAEKSSSFKKRLFELKPGERVIAGHVAGDFMLPQDAGEKLVFVAGGIGSTPFRSMIQYLADTKEKRDIVFFYANKTTDDIAYKDFFETTGAGAGVNMVHVLAEPGPEWTGEKGFMTAEMIKKYVPDFLERRFYLSGPNAMVTSYRKLLLSMGVSRSNIVTDYFPGF